MAEAKAGRASTSVAQLPTGGTGRACDNEFQNRGEWLAEMLGSILCSARRHTGDGLQPGIAQQADRAEYRKA